MKLIILLIIIIYSFKYVRKSEHNFENYLMRYMKHEKYYIDLNQNKDKLEKIISYAMLTRE